MKRLVVTMAACIIALAAPAQVWCQATCAAAVHEQAASAVTPHCPSHDQLSGGSVTNPHQDQCRAPEGSRSANPVRTFVLASAAAILDQVWHTFHAQPVMAVWTPPSTSTQTPAFNHSTPLRI